MPQPNQPQGKKQIKIVDNIPGAEYANAMQVNHNKDEVQIIFLNIAGASGRVSSKVITSPSHLKRMVKAFEENIKKYEANYGKIEAADSPSEDIGFKG